MSPPPGTTLQRGLEAVAVGVYRILLLLLPRAFRREEGDEVVALFRRTVRDGREEQGIRGALRATFAGWTGVVRAGMEEIRHPCGPREPGGPGEPGGRKPRGPGEPGGPGGPAGQQAPGGPPGLPATTSLRYAFKVVTRAPGPALGVVALLGLGIGATVTVLSVVDGVLVRSLPYPEPDRVVVVTDGAHSWPDFQDWTRSVPAFESLAAATGQTFTLTGDEPVDIEGARISARFFGIVEASAVRGRLPTATEFREGRAVAVLGHGAWLRRWGADPGIVGDNLSVDGEPVQVVGVLDPGFVPPAALTGPVVELWVPVRPGSPDLTRHDRSFSVVGRLRDGATLEEAAAQLRARAEAFAREFPDSYAAEDGTPRRTFSPVTLQEATTGDTRGPLLVLLAGAGLLLLVGCGNAASLLLARGATRRGELAVRRALGGSRRALRAQVLAESGMLAAGGGVLGLALAAGGVALVKGLEPGDLPRLGEVGVDLRIVGVGFAVALVAGLLAGIVPASRASRVPPAAVMRETGRGYGDRRHGAGGRALVVAQAALASLLLAGSLAVIQGASGSSSPPTRASPRRGPTPSS